MIEPPVKGSLWSKQHHSEVLFSAYCSNLTLINNDHLQQLVKKNYARQCHIFVKFFFFFLYHANMMIFEHINHKVQWWSIEEYATHKSSVDLLLIFFIYKSWVYVHDNDASSNISRFLFFTNLVWKSFRWPILPHPGVVQNIWITSFSITFFFLPLMYI